MKILWTFLDGQTLWSTHYYKPNRLPGSEVCELILTQYCSSKENSDEYIITY